MDPPNLLVCAGVAAVALACVRKAFYDPKLVEIPIVGESSFLSRIFLWLHPVDLRNAPEIIQQGYDAYPDRVFRVARRYHWEFVVCSPKLVREVANAPESVLSFHEGVEEALQVKFTMGPEITENAYHHIAIRGNLTRNLHRCFPDVRDEIVCAFDDVLQLVDSEWKTLPVLPTMMAIVARVSNRLFVNLPLCRNQAYLGNNIRYTIALFTNARRIAKYPPFLRPFVAPFIINNDESKAAAMHFLGPILQERLAKERELGPDWAGKPNDLISWLLENAEGTERTPAALVLRILSVNMAAIHTSSSAFTFAINDLAAHPEHLLPMREEAERVVKEEGWTKAALNSMVKIDSFLRESQRINGGGSTNMTRKVISPGGFAFSDGTHIPRGSLVSVAAKAIHSDPANYKDPMKFDGFRFSREREEQKLDADPEKEIFHRHMVATAVDHLPFGTGRHACPGRFFAATELKAMLAHVVINYDVKAEVEGVRPANGDLSLPNASGMVCFRRRVAV